ncbi:hypothetical protein ADE_36230 [Achromobacter denitrificans]|nr:hypothetical protein ADE_36230 [Achromobacter denitrificans]
MPRALVSRNMLRSSHATSIRAGGARELGEAAATAASGPLRARTKKPAPRRDCTRPRATSRSYASTTVNRLTPDCSAILRMEGRRVPGRKPCSSMRRARPSASWATRVASAWRTGCQGREDGAAEATVMGISPGQ